MSVDLTQLQAVLDKARQEVQKVIIGQKQVVDLALVTIITGQHALIEGVPGVGKTLLVRTLATVLGSSFARIQFTPDLMPADITGTHIYRMETNEFTLVKGPVFTAFLLADEINRAPAKTQSALLQAMQDRVVTIDRKNYRLPETFSVFATQNPVEFEGTYPLPEAQKDRFMLKIMMDGPTREEELNLATRTLGKNSPERVLSAGQVAQVLSAEQLIALRSSLQLITLREELVGYALDLVRATRSHPSVLVGAGPRATQALLLASRAFAAVSGRDYVTPDDIKGLAAAILGHRLILRPEFEIEGLTVEEVIRSMLESQTVPR
jgi:MoxR-like ATPase